MKSKTVAGAYISPTRPKLVAAQSYMGVKGTSSITVQVTSLPTHPALGPHRIFTANGQAVSCQGFLACHLRACEMAHRLGLSCGFLVGLATKDPGPSGGKSWGHDQISCSLNHPTCLIWLVNEPTCCILIVGCDEILCQWRKERSR